jgi:hypothetical protein
LKKNKNIGDVVDVNFMDTLKEILELKERTAKLLSTMPDAQNNLIDCSRLTLNLRYAHGWLCGAEKILNEQNSQNNTTEKVFEDFLKKI